MTISVASKVLGVSLSLIEDGVGQTAHATADVFLFGLKDK